MAVLQAQRPKKATWERGVVTCVKCASPIYVYKIRALPEEFSLRCTRCGDRGIYAKRSLGIESLRERRKKSRD